ncbi:MAG: HNH endonuclease [Dehalococcoidia bacterium]|nr:HNH endonuclease [Dehalococcoidia bacterium]
MAVDLEEIRHLYVDEKLSSNEIVRKLKLNIVPETVRTYLNKMGVEIRNRSFYTYSNCQWMNPDSSKPQQNKRVHHKFKRFDILARDGFKCRYCGHTAQEEGIKLCVEHIIPISRGGNNNPANLITACCDCNVRKRNKALLGKNGQIPFYIAITEAKKQ